MAHDVQLLFFILVRHAMLFILQLSKNTMTTISNLYLFADQIPPWFIVFAFLPILPILMTSTGLFAVFLAPKSLLRCYEGIDFVDTPRSGDVIIRYNTYHGLLIWTRITTHYVALPPRDARILLGRLVRFNATWALSSFISLFVIPMAILNYFVQLGSLRTQIENQQRQDISQPNNTPEAEKYLKTQMERSRRKPSPILRIGGWIVLFLGIVSAISIIPALIQGDQEAALGACIGAIVLGLGGYALISNPYN